MTQSSGQPCLAELLEVAREFRHDEQRLTVLHDVSLRAHAGELVLLLGPSGSGKTTLLTIMAGLLQPTRGHVTLFGHSLVSYNEEARQQLRAHKLGFIFQNFQLIDFLTVRENLRLILDFSRSNGLRAHERIDDLLSHMKIGHLKEKFPPQLSHGEKQRVAIARALVNDPGLILADEPTASLDWTQGHEVVRLLHSLTTEGNRCVVVASHDLRLKDYADRVLQLVDGKLEETMQQAEPASLP